MKKKEPITKLMSHGAIDRPKVYEWGGGFRVLHIPSGFPGSEGIVISIEDLEKWSEYFNKLADFYGDNE